MSEQSFARALESFTVAVEDRMNELQEAGETEDDTVEILGEIAQLLHELP